MNPTELLASIADALNKLQQLGASVTLRHDAVITDYGYVLEGTNGWAPKPKEVWIPLEALVPCPDDD
jgi:hypothetical protein